MMWAVYSLIVEHFYPLFILISNLYFAFVDAIFDSFYQHFRRKQTVEWPSSTDTHLKLSARKAAQKIRLGEISSRDLVQAYVTRIKQVNPVINAIASDNFTRALREAETVDEYINSLGFDEKSELVHNKPLLGVPFTCKDNLPLAGLICFAGDPKNRRKPLSEKDAEVVQRICNAGAILLASSNMADCMETENDVIGRTNNPYDTRRTPGGSSGGEGALLSSACSVIGIGNDLGGSIRVPATFCGVFGLKTTPGKIPLDGLVAAIKDEYRWTIGPMCRYAEDLDLLFDIMSAGNIQTQSDLEKFDISKIKIFSMNSLNTFLSERPSKEIRGTVSKAIKYLGNRHSCFTQVVDFPIIHHVFEMWSVGRYSPNDPPPSLISMLIDLELLLLGIKGKAERTYFELGLDLLGWLVYPRNVVKRQMILNKTEKLRMQIKTLLGDDGVLIFPAFPIAAPWHHRTKFAVFNLAYTTIFNVLGVPSLACPMGLSKENGMPLAIQIVGAPNSERLLCAVARILEQEFGGWTIPTA